VFTTKPGSRDIWTSAGERIANFLEEPAVSLVRRRVQGLTEDDLSQQTWIIRAAFATMSKESDRPRVNGYTLTEPSSVPNRGGWLKAARAAGDWLESHACRGERDASWIGLTLGQDRRWSLAPAGLDLYDGLPGIALFLAYLGAATQ